MLSLPDTASLLPQTSPVGPNLYAFPSQSTELVKLDLIHEAGSAYQPQPLCASAANHLFTVASDSMDARQVAEFIDYRGIVIDHNPDTLCATTSIYFLRRYLDELLPVMQSLLARPAFPQDYLTAFLNKRRQELQANSLKSRDVARRIFYQSLFGPEHPLGCHASPDDADRLDRDTVLQFFHEHYTSRTLIVSGNVDGQLLSVLAPLVTPPAAVNPLPAPQDIPLIPRSVSIPGAVQTTLRVGRILPLAWDDPDYAQLMLLTTLLGGYFGSRLMSNLREDKGYTYGIHAHTQIYRGIIVFYITADMAASTADAAEDEIRRELQRLSDEPVEDDELAMVKKVLVGDFIRSIDGVFEHSERLRGMLATGVTETFTDNLRRALNEATADSLRSLAQRFLSPGSMVYCRAGVCPSQ